MTIDKITAKDLCEAATKYNTMPEDTMGIGGHYTAVCYDANGNVKWTDEITNIVTTVALLPACSSPNEGQNEPERQDSAQINKGARNCQKHAPGR